MPIYLEKLIVLEYSPSQRAFHRHALIDHIKKNLEAIRQRRPSDWMIIAAYKNYDAASNDFEEQRAEISKLAPESDLSDSRIEDLLT